MTPTRSFVNRSSGQCRTAKTFSFASPLEHLAVTGSDEVAILLQSRLIVLPAQFQGFGSKPSQFDEIGVLQGLDVGEGIHGCTIAH